MECTCANAACAVRIARRLLPFCRIQSTQRVEAEPVFSTYRAAAAAAQGRRIVSVRRVGGPKRFVLI